MTISLSLVLVLLIALWSTANGVDLGSNTIILAVLLISLIALSLAQNRCYNRQALNQNNLLNNFF